MSDEVTRDLRGSDPPGSAVDPASATATATAAPTPRSNPHANTLTDSGDGMGALAATLAQAADAPDLVGKSLDRYRVLSRLGAGGMGVVYAALDPALDRKVALKVLPPLAEDRGAHLEARLRREAQALARLDHPNVVRVYDVGVAAQSVYVAMQLVDGTTLAEKLDKDKPPAKEILALFVAAARGLAAAHQAGIVHRDVKPSNVLVDRTGRVCVGDFGLARGAAEAPELGDDRAVTTTSENLLDESMTREGSVLGTPLFMSPEQHRGESATARSDQFSFCVSLWQALFGDHPFVRGRWNLATAVDAMARDDVRDPPARVVPARVVRALRRGMRHDPDARWPSMNALIDELSPRSRRPWIAAGLALAGIAGGVGLSLALAGGGGDPCANAGAALAPVWGSSTAKQLRDAFAKTQLPYANLSATRTIERLDQYGTAWADMRVDACRANRERGEQSDATLDRRMRCLDRRLTAMSGLVAILAHDPSADVVDRSVSLADGMVALDDCADVKALDEITEPPVSPAARAERDRIDHAAQQLRTELNVGVATDAVAKADALIAAARKLDAPDLLARTLILGGDVRRDQNDRDGAMPMWREAATVAAHAHDDHEATHAMHDIAEALDSGGQPEQALVALDDADLFASRTSAPLPTDQSDLLVVRASALDALDRFAESDAAYQHALELDERAHGKDSWQVAESLVDRTKVLNDVGRYDESIALLQRAIPVLEKELGPTHPDVARAYHNLGTSYIFKGEHDKALETLQKALAIKQARYPNGSASVALTLQSIGLASQDQGNMAEAEKDYQAALDMRTRLLGAEHPDTLSSMYQLGSLRRMQGRYDDARALLERVLAGRIHRFGEMHTTVANTLDALANVELQTGNAAGAADERRRALSIREKLLGPWSSDLTISLDGLAEIDLSLGKCPEARDLATRAAEIFAHNKSPWWEMIEPLGIAAYCEQRPPQLAELRTKLEPIVAQALAGKDADRRGDSQFALGMVLYAQGDHAHGLAMIKKGAEAYRDGGEPAGAGPMEDWLKAHPR